MLWGSVMTSHGLLTKLAATLRVEWHHNVLDVWKASTVVGGEASETRMRLRSAM